MERRDLCKSLAVGAMAPMAAAQTAVQRVMPPLKITDVKTILTQPAGSGGGH